MRTMRVIQIIKSETTWTDHHAGSDVRVATIETRMVADFVIDQIHRRSTAIVVSSAGPSGPGAPPSAASPESHFSPDDIGQLLYDERA